MLVEVLWVEVSLTAFPVIWLLHENWNWRISKESWTG